MVKKTRTSTNLQKEGMSKRKLSLDLEGGKPETTKDKEERITELGNDSQVIYFPKFLGYQDSWEWLDYLNTHMPWTRPTIRVFGRSCVQSNFRTPSRHLPFGEENEDFMLQCAVIEDVIPLEIRARLVPTPRTEWKRIYLPRDTCYVATPGLTDLVYSGYQPDAYSWDDYPRLKELLDLVHKALPGSSFNSLLLNRYKAGNDYVGWHSDDEKLYGPTPEIASLSFGCERDFILKKKSSASTSTCNKKLVQDDSTSKRLKRSSDTDQYSFTLKHGSLLVMKGYTQRDWLHSIPKRAKADALRINLTFRFVL